MANVRADKRALRHVVQTTHAPALAIRGLEELKSHSNAVLHDPIGAATVAFAARIALENARHDEVVEASFVIADRWVYRTVW